MKKYFLLILVIMCGCRTYNPQLVADKYKYDTANISRNYDVTVYGKSDVEHIPSINSNKFYKVKVNIERTYADANAYSAVMSIMTVATLGVPAFMGIPSSYYVGECRMNASIYSDNDNILKSIQAKGNDTEYVAMYYGYNINDAREKAADISCFLARNNILKLLEDISVDELNGLNGMDAERVKHEKMMAQKQHQQSIAANKKKAEERKKRLIEKYGEKTAEAIIKQKIFRGMSESALVESWGRPEEINSSVGSWGTHKQYVYGSGNYVYVENGVITSWQTSSR